jgi:hypothetical protein
MTCMLDETAHSCLRDATPSKYLHSIPCSILRASSTVHFQKGDLACKLGGLFLVRLLLSLTLLDGHTHEYAHHVAHLVRDVLQPRL